MAVYVVRRLAWSAVLLVAVTLNAYVLFYVVPTDDARFGGAFANASEDTGVNRFEVEGSVADGIPALPRAGRPG